jgi:hypothetical protein
LREYKYDFERLTEWFAPTTKGLKMVFEIHMGVMVGLKVTVGRYVSVTRIVEMTGTEMMVGIEKVLMEGMQAPVQKQTLRY